MPLFAARLASGMCLIGEAETEQHVWEDFLRRDHPDDLTPDDKIISVRRLAANAFLSRWYPETGMGDPDTVPGKPAGYLTESGEEELLQNEYTIIASAHRHAHEEVPLLLPQNMPDEASPDDLLTYQVETWIANLTGRLRQAVELEMERYAVEVPHTLGTDTDPSVR